MSSKRILVIEKDPITCEVISVVLEDFGFELNTVSDAEQALQVARDAPPHLILLDISMPGAFELCSRLKLETSTRGAIIILMTQDMDEEELRQVVNSGADAQVSKPFSPLGLLAIVHESLQRQTAGTA